MKLLVIGDFQGVFSGKLERELEKEDFDAIIGVGDYAGLKEFFPYVKNCLRMSVLGKPLKTPEEFFGKMAFKVLLKKDSLAGKNVLRKLSGFGKPIILVFGNGDDDWYTYKFAKTKIRAKKSKKKLISRLKIRDITYASTKFKWINFLGFGGYMDIDAYFDREEFPDVNDRNNLQNRMQRRKRSKEDFFKRLKLIDRKNLILVLHYPPKGVFDIIKSDNDNPMNGKSSGIGFFREAIRKFKPRLVLCGHMHEYRGIKRINGVPIINPGDAEKGRYAIIELPESSKGGKGKIRVRFVR